MNRLIVSLVLATALTVCSTNTHAQETDPHLIRTFMGHTNWVRSVAISPDGQTIVSGSWDKTVRVWRLSDGQLLRTLTGHTNFVQSVTISPDGQTIVSGGFDNIIHVWRLSDGQLLRTLKGHTDAVTSVAISSEELAIVSGSWDNTVRVWQLSEERLLRTLTGHTWAVYSVAISPDAQTVISGSGDKTVRVWRLSDGQLLRTLTGHTNFVQSAAISPDGQTIVSGGFDKTVRVWRLLGLGTLHSFTGHTSFVSTIAISPDNRTVVSGSYDKTIRVWRLSDGRLLHTLTGHTGPVESVAISPDGRIIVSGSRDSTIRVWRMPEDASLPEFSGPPRLTVSASLAEPSGNSAVDAFENATVVLRVRNDGAGPAAGLRPIVEGSAAGLTISPPDAVRALNPGAETELRVGLRAAGTLRDGTVTLRIVVDEARGYRSDPIEFTFETRAERAPELEIARIGMSESFGNRDGAFQPGESVEVVAFVHNAGTGPAESVSAEITIGDRFIYLLTPTRATLGSIPPGGVAELALGLRVPPTYNGPPRLPITIRFADRRERFRWESPLGLTLAERTPTVQSVRVEAALEPSATAPAAFGSGSAAVARPEMSFRVALLPLECPDLPASAITALTETFRNELLKTYAFDVMERDRMDQIAEEQGFSVSACTDVTCAIEIGRVLTVDHMVQGTVAKVGETYSVNIRMFSVETSRTSATSTRYCEGCPIDRVMQLTLPQAAADLAADALSRARR